MIPIGPFSLLINNYRVLKRVSALIEGRIVDQLSMAYLPKFSTTLRNRRPSICDLNRGRAVREPSENFLSK